jgi:hypothetical protein
MPFVLNSSLLGNATSIDKGDSLNIIPSVPFDPGFDPLMTFLVARYSATDSDSLMSHDDSYGHHPVNHCGWQPKGVGIAWYVADIMTCLVKGDNKYESTPTNIAFQSGTNSLPYQAFTNRGANYMGTPTESWWQP